MKTSKYLQLFLLLFIVGTTLTLFINGKNHFKNVKINLEDIFDSKLLANFSVIVANENANFNLSKNEKNSAVSNNKNYDVLKENYNFKDIEVKNDTLFVNSIDSKYNLTIYSKSAKKIIGLKNSKISLNNFYSDTLNIDLIESRLTGSLKSGGIDLFRVSAKDNSEINLYKITHIKKEGVIKKQQYSKFRKAEIKLENQSQLNMPKPLQLIIEADSLSTYKIFN